MENIDILHIRETDSTNNFIREILKYSDSEFLCVRSDNQTSGKGRNGKSWISEPKKDLTFSLAFKTKYDFESSAAFSIIAGVSLYRVLSEYIGKENLKIKWPNDVYYKDQKISGILCEYSLNKTGDRYVIIGIGVNVNSKKSASSLIQNPAISLKEIIMKETDIEYLMKKIITEIQTFVQNFKNEIPQNIIEEWSSNNMSQGREVIFDDEGILKSGIFESINNDASITLLCRETGNKIIHNSEVLFV